MCFSDAIPNVCRIRIFAFCFFTNVTTGAAGWLHDGKIVVEEYNFSLVSPNENSKWSYARPADIDGRKATAFLVDASKDARYLVAVWDMPTTANSIRIKGFVDNFVNGMKETMPKDWRIDDAKIEPSDFPQAHSLKIKIAIHMPNDSTMYANGHLVMANRSYMIIDFSPKTVESPQFTRFAGSFAFLSPPMPSNALEALAHTIG